jgi:hypothetical protein
MSLLRFAPAHRALDPADGNNAVYAVKLSCTKLSARMNLRDVGCRASVTIPLEITPVAAPISSGARGRQRVSA